MVRDDYYQYNTRETLNAFALILSHPCFSTYRGNNTRKLYKFKGGILQVTVWHVSAMICGYK